MQYIAINKFDAGSTLSRIAHTSASLGKESFIILQVSKLVTHIAVAGGLYYMRYCSWRPGNLGVGNTARCKSSLEDTEGGQKLSLAL
jgi:hypothetical protein